MATVPTFTIGGKIKAADLNFLLGGTANRKPSFRAHLAATQSVPNNASTVIKFDTVDEDTDSAYSVSTGIYTVATAGLWLLAFSSIWTANGTGIRYHSFTQNNVAVQAREISAGVDSQGRDGLAVVLRAVATDTFYVAVLQTSGGALNFGGSAPAPSFSATWLGA